MCGWFIGDGINLFSLRNSNIGEIPYEVSVLEENPEIDGPVILDRD